MCEQGASGFTSPATTTHSRFPYASPYRSPATTTHSRFPYASPYRTNPSGGVRTSCLPHPLP